MIVLANQLQKTLQAFDVTAVSNTTPIQVTTYTHFGVGPPHGLVNGDLVYAFGDSSMTALNGIWVVTVIDSYHFTLNGSAGNSAYTGAGFAHVGFQTPPVLVDSTQLAQFNTGDFTLTFVLGSATPCPVGFSYPLGPYRKQITPPALRAWFSDGQDAGMISGAPVGGIFSSLGAVPAGDSRVFTVKRANAPDARIGTDLLQYLSLNVFFPPGSNAEIGAFTSDSGVTPTIGQLASVQAGNSFVFSATIS